MRKVVFVAIFLYLFLFEGCSVESPSKVFSIPVNYQLKDSDDYIFSWYFNKFGEREYLGRRNEKNVIHSILPTIIFFGGNDLVHQPILLKSDKNITVSKRLNRHYFDNLESNCFFDLLEQTEAKFGFCHFSDFLSKEIEIEEFLQYTRKNVDVVRGHKHLIEEQINFIKNFSKKCNIDKKNYKYLQSVLQDYYKLRVISSIIKTDIDTLTYKKKIKKEIKKFRKNTFNRLDSKYPTSIHAQKLVYLYNRLICKDSINTKNEFDTQWKSASMNYKGKSKEFLKFILLKKYLNRNVPNLDFYINEFQQNCKDLDYKNYIDSLVSLERHIFNREELNTQLKDTLNNTLIFNDILTQNKGEVIYIDFWASWCMPCREEMMEYPKVDDFFIKNKIKPILISIDQDKIAWKSAIKKTEVQYRKNYLIDKDSPLATFFKVSPIPRYVLIDRNGKIAQFTAARISNINELTKQVSNIIK